jgi:hypothetical protein
MTTAKYYLAGPMTGIPQFNFPLFYRVAGLLRQEGYLIVSPAELDDAEDAGAALQSATGDPKTAKRSWGDFLARDVKILADGGITGIVFLPGWEKSRGARLEATVGLLLGFHFMRWDEEIGAPVPYSKISVASALHAENMR